MLPPDLSADDDLLAQAKHDWRRAYSHWRRWRTEAKESYGFVSGDGQWSEDDKQFLMRQGRPTVVVNRTAVFVDAVAGAEVQNRQELRYIPRELGDVAVNETITAAAKYFRDQCDAEDEESAAFGDCLVAGVGVIETRMNFDDDPDGTIVIERVDPFEVFWDPAAKRQNFADARFVFRVQDMTKDDVEQEWPGATDTLMPGAFAWGDVEDDDEEPHETIHGRQYELGKGRPGVARRRRYRVVEYQRKEWKPIHRTVDPVTGKEATFDSRRWAMLQKAFKEMGGEPPPSIRQKRVEVQRAFFLGDTVLEEGSGPCQHDFTYQAITGKLDRNHGTWYGIVRAMKDPQRWANKFFSQILHIINSNAKGGLLAETDAFDDARDAEDRWAEADSIIWMRPGGTSKISPKPMPGVPADITGMMQFCVQSLRDVTGINLELLGMQTQEQPGILEFQRKQAGLTILASLFNALRRYRKTQGRLMLYFMQRYIPEGRLVRMSSSEGGKWVPLMKQAETAQYDVVVDEAPSSPNLKEQVFGVMQVLGPQLMAMGVRIPPEALDYMPLPESLVAAIREANTPKEGQQPPPDPATAAVQAQAAATQAKMQSDAQLGQARLQSEHELAVSRMQLDAQLKREQLEMQRKQGDVDAQVASAKLQLEALKLQATMGGMLADPTEDLRQLASTVAANHQAMQEAMGAFGTALGEQGARGQALESALGEQASALTALQAPREVVRDATGRIVGVRPASGGNGTAPVGA